MKRYALISVSDKTGVVEFATGLVAQGFTILSTGGTYSALRNGGVEAEEVASYTGFPEIMAGRVKTLHPKVHGGILGRRDLDGEVMQQHGIDAIDVVAVNLYPFRATRSRAGATAEEVIENIDIGGPAMLRSAAKNHAAVTVVVDPADYPAVLESLQGDTAASLQLRSRLAGKAFAHTASYDTAIASYFDEQRAARSDVRFGPQFGLVGEKIQDLRYGENPQQSAAFYRDPDASQPSLAAAKQLSGKELSYNNILDLDSALRLVAELDQPGCAIIKHNNPCGVAVASDAMSAFAAALQGDPVSAFGGIVSLNRELDVELATAMVEQAQFLEAIIAPSVVPAALQTLGHARWGGNVRVVELGGMPTVDDEVLVRPVSGGFLLQDHRPAILTEAERVVTKRAPDSDERQAMLFAMRVCKHVRSNAIVLARGRGEGCFATVGIGAGQMSRVDAAKIAVEKAGDNARGSVLASDAFFPFADGLQAAAAAGVVAVVQPGGSKRDDEVVAAADSHGMAMLFTGCRHFRH